MKLLGLLALAACDPPLVYQLDAQPETWDLTRTRTLAPEHQLGGVETDGENGVWLAYDTMHLAHFNAANEKIGDVTLVDDGKLPAGIARDGDVMWIALREPFWLPGSVLRAVDLATGATLRELPGPNYTVDLDVVGDELRVATEWNTIASFDRATGSERWILTTQELEPNRLGTMRGIATGSDGQMWVGWKDLGFLTVFGANHAWANALSAEVLGGQNLSGVHMFLAHDGTATIVGLDNQISWLVIEETP